MKNIRNFYLKIFFFLMVKVSVYMKSIFPSSKNGCKLCRNQKGSKMEADFQHVLFQFKFSDSETMVIENHKKKK